jgi:7-carboxy-7-deazaguanine synthase
MAFLLFRIVPETFWCNKIELLPLREEKRMRVAEIFYSIQGEGPAMGRPATFVRLAGCNLQCEGCDTVFGTWRDLSLEDILEEIAGERVVVTGGEPTLQMEELSKLIDLLHNEGKEIHIETNGTRAPKDEDIKKLRCIVVSPKHGSDVDFALWSSYKNVHFKFVLGPKPWCWTERHLEEILPRLPVKRVWIMPFGADAELKCAGEAWDLALLLGVNYSDRLHIRVGKR